MSQLTLEYWEDDGWFIGRFVEVPGVFSQGESIEDLKENIQDAYKMMIDSEPLESFPGPRNRVTVEVRP
ncbi:MAG: type II toxin-antitoxin system HicB family antitoxin [Deltaproteobacteria bacterium]|nr:type II toxin-antitoxin system HicB family antitoxin [Deltaproteobacteria bacterium]